MGPLAATSDFSAAPPPFHFHSHSYPLPHSVVFVSLSVPFRLWPLHFWSHPHRHPYQIIKIKLRILYTHIRHMRVPGMDISFLLLRL